MKCLANFLLDLVKNGSIERKQKKESMSIDPTKVQWWNIDVSRNRGVFLNNVNICSFYTSTQYIYSYIWLLY